MFFNLFDSKFRTDIRNFVVITGQKCSLRCKNCANFSPYFDKKLDFYESSKIIKDMKLLLGKVNSIGVVQLQGGEFFLHKDAVKIIKSLASQRKIKTLQIATNAVAKLHDKIIKAIVDYNVILRISEYGDVNKKHVDKLIQICETNGIKYFKHTYANGDFSWSYCGDKNTPCVDDHTAQKYYSECAFRYCFTLENGVIANCSRATVSQYIFHYSYGQGDILYVNRKLTAKAIKEYVERTKFTIACKYCYGSMGGAVSLPASNYRGGLYSI